MEEIKYTKPALKFVGLRNQERIANICFPNGGPAENIYNFFDTNGTGWIRFQPNGDKNCVFNDLTFVYYKNKDDKIGEPIKDLNDYRIKELEGVFGTKGNGSTNGIYESFQSKDDRFLASTFPPDLDWS